MTEELLPEAPVSSCPFVQGMLRPEVIEELELEKFGLKSTAPDVQGFARFEEAGETELLNEFMLMSANDLLSRYITSERLNGFIMFLGMVSIWDGPQTPQTAYVYDYHTCGEFENVFSRWALPIGYVLLGSLLAFRLGRSHVIVRRIRGRQIGENHSVCAAHAWSKTAINRMLGPIFEPDRDRASTAAARAFLG